MKTWPLILTVALAGCATVDPKKGHDQVAKTVRERIGADTGWGEGAPGAERLAERVRALAAAGLTPERAVEIALLNNPGLQQTYEELNVSQADMVQAGLLSNPSLDVALGFPLAPGPIHEFELGLVHEFLSVFTLPLRKRVAQAQFEADVNRVSHEALAVAAEVKAQLVAMQARLALLERQRLVTQTAALAADLAIRQHRAGNITELELAERTAAHEALRVEQARTELGVVAQRERLNRLLGLWGPDVGWKLAGPLPSLPDEELQLAQLESLAIRQRLDLAAARGTAALMAQAAELARTWRFFGHVEVGVDTHQDPDGPRLVGPMLSLELPIFDQRQAEIARLEALQRQSERRLRELAVNARSEVREARATLLAARQLVEHFQRTVLPLRARVVEQAQLQYNGMQLGLYELLDAKREQVEAEQSHLEALQEYWTARIELERLLGGALPNSPVSARNETP